MRTQWLFLVILVVFGTGVASTVLIIQNQTAAKIDIVAINGIVKTLENHWGNIEQGDYSAVETPFTVIDNNGEILYQTHSGLPAAINDAIRNRHTIVDIMHNNGFAGKLIIHHQDQEMIHLMKEKLVTVILLSFTVLGVLCVLYLLYLHHTVFKPFRKLQGFAAQVARGNLDVPLSMDKNNRFGAFTESFDIMREELAAARQREYASNRSKRELVASLSHDIKTPVASIKAVSELMLVQATEEKVIKQLNTIHTKAEQIDLLVTDMFHATLEELQELKVTATEESSAVLKEMIASVNYHNQISCDPIPECIILVDAMRLQQVLDNILSNSYKYAGTPVVISSHINRAYLELNIMDYGEGVPQDELPLLFNKYYRGTSAEVQIGSGLGLYISQYFMQNMQGDIECHNREDGFTVTLRMKLA